MKRGRPKIKHLEDLEGREELFKEIKSFINTNIGKKRTYVFSLIYEGEKGNFHMQSANNLDRDTPLYAWQGILTAFGNYFRKLFGEYDISEKFVPRQEFSEAAKKPEGGV